MSTGADDALRFPPPPERIELPGGRALVRVRRHRTAAAVRAINESLDHLRPWMAWAAEPATEESIGTFFEESEVAWDEGRDFGYSIVVDAGRGNEEVIGGSGLHARLGRTGLEIGYWVHVDHAGRGVATDAARALTDAAFALDGVERVRIRCEVANVASGRVPAKLGYALTGEVTADDEDDPCAGRRLRVWLVERADWRSGEP